MARDPVPSPESSIAHLKVACDHRSLPEGADVASHKALPSLPSRRVWLGRVYSQSAECWGGASCSWPCHGLCREAWVTHTWPGHGATASTELVVLKETSQGLCEKVSSSATASLCGWSQVLWPDIWGLVCWEGRRKAEWMSAKMSG